jgi:uncharacterized protein (TIGR02466 family)
MKTGDENPGAVGLQVMQVFPTLFGKLHVRDAALWNERLKQRILERQATTPSEDYANSGGWHSPSDLLDSPWEEMRWLRGAIAEGLNGMVKATMQLPEVQSRQVTPSGAFSVAAWANVSRRGDYHRMHNHPGSAWSGCYYVTGKPDPTSLAGTLELYDPRPFTEMTDVPGTPYGQRLVIRPEAGLMVLFPGWLYHFVHPVASDEPRISIAFNATWKRS